MKYPKRPYSIDEQLDLLEERGMIIENRKSAGHFLATHNYYRFSGYALHFEIFENRKRTHKFIPGTKFNDAIRIYEFDVKLRNLIFQAVKEIEIAFRTQLCLILANKYKDSHWYLRKDIYDSSFPFDKFIEDCRNETERSREIFIKHYLDKYDDPALPASWMLIEIMTFGKWSMVYGKLKNKEDRKEIAAFFNVKEQFLSSWVQCLSFIRNLFSHHSRIWNKNFPFVPNQKREYNSILIGSDRIGTYLCVIHDLMLSISPEYKFFDKVKSLIDSYPEIPIDRMGLKQGWDKPELWQFGKYWK